MPVEQGSGDGAHEDARREAGEGDEVGQRRRPELGQREERQGDAAHGLRRS